MGNENTKLCETCRHPYESEDHLCRKAMPASDGGPAFPVSADVAGMEGLKGSAMGMSLRDYFAAKVMQGLLANPGGPIQENGMSGWDWCKCTVEDVAGVAWHIADAMLRARGIAPAADPVREAAPELLEAASRLFNLANHFHVGDVWFTGSDEHREALEGLEAAIARATGQETSND